MKLLLISICCLTGILSAAQTIPLPAQSIPSPAQELPYAYMARLSPRLRLQPGRFFQRDSKMSRFLLSCSDTAAIRQLALDFTDSFVVRYHYGDIFSVQTYPPFMLAHLLPLPAVTFIDDNNRKAKEEVAIADFDYSANAVNKTHYDYPGLNGSGTVVSVREDEPDTADIDFKGRFLALPAGSGTLSSHATIMGTIIAGGGNSFYTGKGVAWGAFLSSSPFADLLPDADAIYQQYRITVQNHSYGTGIENYYGADAAAYDASVINNPSLLHVFSSGNSGDQASTTGAYQGIAGWANLTGSFKMAKNILTVGSVDSFYQVPLLSSKGPAYDGRVKPELVAYGEDGSSGAAALVSGSALLLQQVYKMAHGGTVPDAALVKAVLLNTATGSAPGFAAGFGNLNTWRAVREMQAGHYFSGTVTPGGVVDFSLSLPAVAKNLKVLLCWTDPPAMPNAPVALVNDLDLSLSTGGLGWLPWVLNPASSSLSIPAVRGPDRLNTEEQVTIADPPAGVYAIHVAYNSGGVGVQRFYVAFQWDTAGDFHWIYPSGEDNLLPGEPNLLRWDGAAGAIEYQLAGSMDWQPVTAAASGGYFLWTTPDTSAVAQLRTKTGGQVFLSDTFSISPRLHAGVGFSCPDSVLLYWDRSTANKYALYRLGDRYLELQKTLEDSAIILPAMSSATTWYTVASVLPYDKTGLKTYTFDYTRQGVGCYIDNFTADLVGSAAALHLALGSAYRVTQVLIEKRNGAGYRPLRSFTPPQGLDYIAGDDTLHQGVNAYRAGVFLSDGRVLYSDEEVVFYSGAGPYLLYPNPVRQGQPIHLITSGLYNPVLRVYNVIGQQVMERSLYSLLEDIPTGSLNPGLYFYQLQAAGQQTVTGKLVVL